MSRDIAPAARALTLLWAFTALTFWIQPQGAHGYFGVVDPSSKAQWVFPNFVIAALALALPRNRACLGLVVAAAVVSVLAWHSWIGALAPWGPVILLGVIVLANEDAAVKATAVEASVFLALAVLLANRLNAPYLSGWEFGPRGMFSKAFPPEAREPLAANASAAACAWLVLSAIPLGLWLAGRRRAAAMFFAVQGLLVAYLYNVLFYLVFLLVPLALVVDPAFLSSWRKGIRAPVAPRIAYLVFQILFFAQYLGARESRPVYWAVVALLTATLALAEPPRWPARVAWDASPPALRAWLAAFALLLLSPFVVPAIPSPFLATYFSAREVRRTAPARVRLGNAGPECEERRQRFAQRWGYRILDAEGGCWVTVYR